jgi:hypothetical protein
VIHDEWSGAFCTLKNRAFGDIPHTTLVTGHVYNGRQREPQRLLGRLDVPCRPARVLRLDPLRRCHLQYTFAKPIYDCRPGSVNPTVPRSLTISCLMSVYCITRSIMVDGRRQALEAGHYID